MPSKRNQKNAGLDSVTLPGVAPADPRPSVAERKFVLGVEDPSPVANVAVVWRTLAQGSTIAIAFILVIAALYLARPLLLPITSAFVIGMMLGPIAGWARRQGVPQIVVAIVLWLAVIAMFWAIIQLVATPIIEWIGKAPEIGKNIHDKLRVLDAPLTALSDLRNAILPQAPGTPSPAAFDFTAMIQPILTVVTPAIGEIFIFFGVLFFFLLGRAELRQVIVAFFSEREARLRTLKIINDVEHNLTTYLSVVAVINLVVGVAATIIALIVGLPNALAWGVLAFLLNFIPYIGAIMMEAVLFALGLVTFPTLTEALIAPLLYLAFTTIEGHFITPSIMGRRLTLNPLTVFIALIFWTWLWGPIGAFLAVPLLIVALVAINHLFPKEARVLPG